MFKIIQVCERYDGANKMQIEQHCVITQTVAYSEQINWKVLRKHNRTWKMAKWDFAWLLTLERLEAECHKTIDYLGKRSIEF